MGGRYRYVSRTVGRHQAAEFDRGLKDKLSTTQVLGILLEAEVVATKALRRRAPQRDPAQTTRVGKSHCENDSVGSGRHDPKESVAPSVPVVSSDGRGCGHSPATDAYFHMATRSADEPDRRPHELQASSEGRSTSAQG
jgi:hypothetical protein